MRRAVWVVFDYRTTEDIAAFRSRRAADAFVRGCAGLPLDVQRVPMPSVWREWRRSVGA